jgi:hypothetical protein
VPELRNHPVSAPLDTYVKNHPVLHMSQKIKVHPDLSFDGTGNLKIKAREYSPGMNTTQMVKYGFDRSIVNIASNGWKPFIFSHERSRLGNNKSSKMYPKDTFEEIEKLLVNDRIEEINKEEAYDINPLTLVRKPGKNRLCIDTSRIVNKLLPTKGFQMRGIGFRLLNFKKGLWCSKLDLKNGYLHIPLHKDIRKYFAFSWKGRIFRYKWLPFGVNDAPRIFQRMANELSASLKRQGIMTESYLDDFWIQGETKEECKEAIIETVNRITNIGWTVNPKKSILEPTQQLTYLGVEFDSRIGRVRLNKEWVKGTIKDFKKWKSKMTVGNLQRILGKLAFASIIDHRIKPFMMRYYKKLGNNRNKEQILKMEIEDMKWITNRLLQLEFWTKEHFKGIQIITTDASGIGGGYWTTNNRRNSWKWEEGKHSSYTELSTAIRALKECARSDTLNIIRTDNSSTVNIINNGASSNMKLNELIKEFAKWAIINGIHYSAVFIKGIHNSEADELSRQKSTNKKKHPPVTLSQLPNIIQEIQDSLVENPQIWKKTSRTSQIQILQLLPFQETSIRKEVKRKPRYHDRFFTFEELKNENKKYWRKVHKELKVNKVNNDAKVIRENKVRNPNEILKVNKVIKPNNLKKVVEPNFELRENKVRHSSFEKMGIQLENHKSLPKSFKQFTARKQMASSSTYLLDGDNDYFPKLYIDQYRNKIWFPDEDMRIDIDQYLFLDNNLMKEEIAIDAMIRRGIYSTSTGMAFEDEHWLIFWSNQYIWIVEKHAAGFEVKLRINHKGRISRNQLAKQLVQRNLFIPTFESTEEREKDYLQAEIEKEFNLSNPTNQLQLED